MPPSNSHILTINCGSSSIKFALFDAVDIRKRGLHGQIKRIGLSGTNLTFLDPATNQQANLSVTAVDHNSAANFLMNWLDKRRNFEAVHSIGHRIVHGMQHRTPELVTETLLNDLKLIIPYDSEHLPQEIALIEVFRERNSKMPQVACFDTGFHSDMPRVAKQLPIPRRYYDKGIQRYGFHGLSYAFLMEELARLDDPTAKKGRIILAHLGNGASIAAVLDGKGIDTSMSFTPTAGLPMSSRSGDLDPGLVSFLLRTEKLTPEDFQHMVNHESGMLGISELTSDMRDLIAQETIDVRAAEAVQLFCYQVKKWIGSFSAALGGLDTLVFAGGIGENAPLVRSRICEGLNFLGIEIDPVRNSEQAGVISTQASQAKVRVIRTDEEVTIAKSVVQVLKLDSIQGSKS